MVSFTTPKIFEIQTSKEIGERSIYELVGDNNRTSDKAEFINSTRFESIVKKSPYILVFKLVFDSPWNVSLYNPEILVVLLCKQDFPEHLAMYTDSEGCLELS